MEMKRQRHYEDERGLMRIQIDWSQSIFQKKGEKRKEMNKSDLAQRQIQLP